MPAQQNKSGTMTQNPAVGTGTESCRDAGMVLRPQAACASSAGQDLAPSLAVGQKEPFVSWLWQVMAGAGEMPGFEVREEPASSSTSVPPSSAGKHEMAGPAPRLPEP